MGREILFRGFCPSENGKQIITLDGEDIRGDWVYGDLIQNIDCVKIREREAGINRIAKSYEVIPETIGQYTGLKDKNGKKIFEDDIVTGLFNYTDIIGHIVYGSDATFFIERKGSYGIGLNNAEDWLEVIGNIHEEVTEILLHLWQQRNTAKQYDKGNYE